MKIFITGGTGFIGRNLINFMASQGHELTLLSRSAPDNTTSRLARTCLQGDPARPGPWQEKVPGHDVIINLAGASIFCRWTKKNRNSIHDSRVHTTKNIVESLTGSGDKPRLLINGSAIGIYGDRGDENIIETGAYGSDFLAGVSAAWEEEAGKATSYGVRVALCRLGVVLGKGGGALDRMLPLFRLGLGSPLGSGQQWFSWIHIQDLIRAMQFIIDHESLAGPVNFTAPAPVRNRELSTSLGRALHRSVFLPSVPGFMLRLLLGEFADTLTGSQRVLPEKLLANGFQFQFHTLDAALADIIRL